jgi:thiol-disulfide isomerase/thioredoxin
MSVGVGHKRNCDQLVMACEPQFCFPVLSAGIEIRRFVMLNRRAVLAVAALAMFMPPPVFALSEVPFSQAAFQAAQKAGKPILVEIHASWCPTCRAQKPIIQGLLASPKFKDLVTFRMDFDAQAKDVRAMGAQSQSTLVLFKGAHETGRSVGDTDPVSIEKLMSSAL